MLKNDQYKVVDKEFDESGPSCLPTDILALDYNKLKLEDDIAAMKNLVIFIWKLHAQRLSRLSSQKKYLVANNISRFFRYCVENIFKSDESI